jgi:hypothetical protein
MPKYLCFYLVLGFLCCDDIFITEQQVSRHEVIEIIYSYLVNYFACKRSGVRGKTKTQSAAPRGIEQQAPAMNLFQIRIHTAQNHHSKY